MKRAFTLIEVLVVVAIIALLISIMLPSLANARDLTRSTKCLANMRDMGTGMNTFAHSHKGRFQLVAGDAPNPGPYDAKGPNADPDRSIYQYESGTGIGAAGALLCWPAVLIREAGNRSMSQNSQWGIESTTQAAYNLAEKMRKFEVMVCPSDRVAIGNAVWPRTPTGDKLTRWFGRLSYGINEDVAGDRSDQADLPVWNAGSKGGSSQGGDRLRGVIEKTIRPSEVAMFLDMGLEKPPAAGDKSFIGQSIISKSARGPLLEFFDCVWPGRLPTQRHRGGALNVTFVDGHGAVANRNKGAPYGSDADLPQFTYTPRVRVSPYQVGNYPVK